MCEYEISLRNGYTVALIVGICPAAALRLTPWMTCTRGKVINKSSELLPPSKHTLTWCASAIKSQSGSLRAGVHSVGCGSSTKSDMEGTAGHDSTEIYCIYDLLHLCMHAYTCRCLNKADT